MGVPRLSIAGPAFLLYCGSRFRGGRSRFRHWNEEVRVRECVGWAILALGLVPFLLCAQAVQELEGQLGRLSGKDQLPVLLQLAAACASEDPDKAVGYAARAVEMSRQLEDLPSEAKALKSLARAYRERGSGALFQGARDLPGDRSSELHRCDFEQHWGRA